MSRAVRKESILEVLPGFVFRWGRTSLKYDRKNKPCNETDGNRASWGESGITKGLTARSLFLEWRGQNAAPLPTTLVRRGPIQAPYCAIKPWAQNRLPYPCWPPIRGPQRQLSEQRVFNKTRPKTTDGSQNLQA